MTEIEHEKKMLLSESEYTLLQGLLNSGRAQEYDQSNFYYDTVTNTLNRQNTTLRIRLKNGNLTGTRKTHRAGETRSTEEHFGVTDVPSGFAVDGQYVVLKGSLHTHRTEVHLSKDLTLFLDRNEYLDTVDYELELEYAADESRAEGVMLLIGALLHRSDKMPSSPKSERFFLRLTKCGSCEVSYKGGKENAVCNAGNL